MWCVSRSLTADLACSLALLSGQISTSSAPADKVSKVLQHCMQPPELIALQLMICALFAPQRDTHLVWAAWALPRCLL